MSKQITFRCWIRGEDKPIQDENQLSKTDYVSCPKSLMDEDTFRDALDKTNFKYESILESKSGKAYNAYRVGYADDHLDTNKVGLTVSIG